MEERNSVAERSANIPGKFSEYSGGIYFVLSISIKYNNSIYVFKKIDNKYFNINIIIILLNGP